MPRSGANPAALPFLEPRLLVCGFLGFETGVAGVGVGGGGARLSKAVVRGTNSGDSPSDLWNLDLNLSIAYSQLAGTIRRRRRALEFLSLAKMEHRRGARPETKPGFA